MYQQSEQTKNIFAALNKAQQEIEGAKKGTNNPFFKSKYADLGAVWDACRDALLKNGLTVIQTATNNVVPTQDGTKDYVGVTTTLGHESGEWVRDTCFAATKDGGAQAAGSAISYLRRYSLASMVGVVMVDDDGEGSEGREQATKQESAIAKVAAKKEATQVENKATNDSEEQLKFARVSVGKELTRLKWKTESCVAFLTNKYGAKRVSELTLAQCNDAFKFLSDVKPEEKKSE